jgi:hypothetical protein
VTRTLKERETLFALKLEAVQNLKMFFKQKKKIIAKKAGSAAKELYH